MPRLAEFFANNYIQPIAVDIEKSELPRSVDPYGAPLVVTEKEYSLSAVVSVGGSVSAEKAVSAAAVAGDAYDVAVCGVLTMLTEFTSKGGRAYQKFDFETTGLSVAYDRPTEIGAVKITDGVITETFSTLIDPLMPIPEIVSQKTGITDDMVKGKPRFREVLADFYRFSYGCPLIGHNIAFDFPFLLKYGNRYGYVFGAHATFDTMGIAPRALAGIEQLSLNRVLDRLGLVNDNAHRALSDATATAKAFIAMQKLLA